MCAGCMVDKGEKVLVKQRFPFQDLRVRPAALILAGGKAKVRVFLIGYFYCEAIQSREVKCHCGSEGGEKSRS